MKQFLETITTGDMLGRFDEILKQRADVRVLRYMLGSQRMLEWIHSVGVCEDAPLRALAPPLPPLELRSITAAPDLPEFLWTGLVDMERVIALYDGVARMTEEEKPAILDFGCGCGRMVRFLSAYAHDFSIHACEVNPDHVHWCQENLRGIQVAQCKATPPLPYKARMFELVFSLSVFTHLSKSSAIKWLAEMHRILVPGGILIATLQGLVALEIIRDSVLHQQMFNFQRQDVIEIMESFKTGVFLFYPYDSATIEMAKAGEEYGNSFIHPAFLYEKCKSEGFEVLEYLPGGLRGWQDIVILQRCVDSPNTDA
jgi:SAM-dependent methyltransferase